LLRTEPRRENHPSATAEQRTARLEEAVAAWEACLTVIKSIWPPEWVQFVQTRFDKTQAEIGRWSAK
jgi:hypothetical protein